MCNRKLQFNIETDQCGIYIKIYHFQNEGAASAQPLGEMKREIERFDEENRGQSDATDKQVSLFFWCQSPPRYPR